MPRKSLVIAAILAALLHGGVALVRIPASRPHPISEDRPLALSIVPAYKKVPAPPAYEAKGEERRDDRVAPPKRTKEKDDPPPEKREVITGPEHPPVRTPEHPPSLPAVEDSGMEIKKRVTVPPVPCYKNNPSPRYPALARRRGYEGEVLLSARISTDGTVIALKVKESSGYPILDRAAVKAVAAWEFEPARRMGVPVSLSVDIPVRFVLQRP